MNNCFIVRIIRSSKLEKFNSLKLYVFKFETENYL